MNLSMLWEGISKSTVRVECIVPNRSVAKRVGKFFAVGSIGVPVYFHIPSNILEIGTGLKMLEYIFSQEKMVVENHKIFSGESFYSGGVIPWRVRMISYINLVYVLEGLVRRTYMNSLEFLGFFAEGIPELDKDKFLCARKQEIEKFRHWRNKVFAHTSFSDPRGDDLSLQHTSVLLFGNAFSVYKNHFHLGGIAKSFLGARPNLVLPDICIMCDHELVTGHFWEWEKALMVISEKMSQISKKCLESNALGLEKVRFNAPRKNMTIDFGKIL